LKNPSAADHRALSVQSCGGASSNRRLCRAHSAANFSRKRDETVTDLSPKRQTVFTFVLQVEDCLRLECLVSRACHAASLRGATVLQRRAKWRIATTAAIAAGTRRQLCTDNAAMIAALGFFKLQQGHTTDFALEIAPSIGLGVAA